VGLHPIPDDTLRGSDRNIACPACGSEYGITAGPPRFWWYPYRDGAGTGPGGVCIEERPSYRSTLLTAQPLTLKRKVGNRLGRFFRAR
jgi:hypothetical protein